MPAWIEAISSVCLTLLTAFTLKVLWQYATDTKTIANASVMQFENSQMPFLTITQKSLGGGQVEADGWVVENQGFGPAVNIRLKYRTEDIQIPPLAAGGVWVFYSFETIRKSEIPMELSYQSLSSSEYRTAIAWHNKSMKIRFNREI